MTYSVNRDDTFIKELIDHYGVENIPGPLQYPLQCPNYFEFLVKSCKYYKRMQELKGTD